LKCRVNDAEHAQLTEYAKAFGVPVAELLRRAALRVRLVAPVPPENKERYRELGRLANNLNMAVKQSHVLSRRLDALEQGGAMGERVTREELASMIGSMTETTGEALTVLRDIRLLLIDEWEASRGIEIAREGGAGEGGTTT
jgi:DNA-binding HxlR family transcriptional regulator